ncbi:isoleucine--tRNA ligase [Actinomyces minihominis]|uniref:isoleucine--tRNA ligase n=1 Tax=Actinomyces minihominis TaxID=2002838 RepID=UPI000C069D26|nr:isoleucine--tRNA ligase [Actinomyces minihominis]
MADSNSKRRFPLHRDDQEVNPKPSFPAIEEDTLSYWKSDSTFKKSIERRPAGERGSNEFVFYDGPPFANGTPHYGHLLTGYVKDVVGRYQTMLGHRVERRFGWDTHGLPAEIEAERILNIVDKSQIEGPDGIGIQAFNETCETSVLRYTKEWEDYVFRQARWVDFENDYKTLDPDYMESTLWAFKTLFDKGLIYEGHRVLPYCWNDETPLSNHELKMDDDVYQDRTDQTATVGVTLLDEDGAPTDEVALIWTTTPWTLPSNLAIAVGPDVDYVSVVPVSGPLEGKLVIVAEALAGTLAKEFGIPAAVAEGDLASLPTSVDELIVGRFKGSTLVGRRYAPMFSYFADAKEDEAPGPNAFQIVAADFVTTEDGTGLVHLAPAFGEDDMNVCLENGIRTVVPVGESGKFTSEVPDYEGVQVFDANRRILADLRDQTGPLARVEEKLRPVLVKQASYQHSYPHCWRCRQPLIYRAVSSWFVEVTKFRDRMVELNQEISWVPDHLKNGQFGKWLEGARDWSISRTRFWGAPIPVWKSDNPSYPRVDVYGSYQQLADDFGVKVEDINLHRPAVDELVRPNPDDPTGQSMMRRVPEVLDCWFESGAMPFAQVHYPFENREWFDNHYPGDFIVEYIGQTRGWFYTLHVLATALFDRPAFKRSLVHGIILGNDGRKMSKSLRNYPDVQGVFDSYGSDAMRWFLLASPVVRGGNLIVTEEGIRDAVRQVLLPLWNAYYFLTLYGNASNGGAGISPTRLDRVENPSEVFAALPEMDRYLLARTREVTEAVRKAMDEYDLPKATARVRDHLDVITNWYVRTQRQRFWDEDGAAFDSLYTALIVLAEAAAPLLPMVTEEIWRGLTGGESVHLVDYPALPDSWRDDALVTGMDEVQEIVSAAHALRKTEKLRVRQPLATLRVVSAEAESLATFAPIIASEVNVKAVDFETPDDSGLVLREDLSLNPRAFPAQVRSKTSALFQAAKSGEWEALEGGAVVRFPGVEVDGAPVQLSGDQFALTVRVEAEGDEAAAILDSGCFVVLDKVVSPELEAEGWARDVIRLIQDTRKSEDLHVADRIDVVLTIPKTRVEALRTHAELIKHETLTIDLDSVLGDQLAATVTKR